MDNMLDVIFNRRSIRVYQDKEVSQATLKFLLQAAMAAPTANNGQPWEFIAITEKELMDKFRGKLKYGNYNAPAAIAVLANLKIARNDSSIRYWVQDCSAAVENILIAAAGLGLGTVWIGSYPKEEVMAIEREILGIPESIVPLALIYVGYPGEERPARTQYEESRVHWQKY
jgi:nitroreductase